MFFGGAIVASVGLLFWIIRRFIYEVIQHDFAQKLEKLKADLNASMQIEMHKRGMDQLRTSLFFNHQRKAFASLLSQIAETQRKWWEDGFDREEDFIMPVPLEEYKRLEKSFYDHQLFLDRDCNMAMDLVLEAMSDSFPIIDTNDQKQYRDCRKPYDRLVFLQDLVADLFREKIGVGVSNKAKVDLALLGAIRLINHYNFPEIDLLANGALKLTRRDDASAAITKANDNRIELISKLKVLEDSLKKDSFFHGAFKKATQYLDILEVEKDSLHIAALDGDPDKPL